jgi:integrase
MKVRGRVHDYPGVHAIKTKRGGGTYYYLWRRGPRIETTAQIGTPAFHAAWLACVEANRPQIRAAEGKTLADLIRVYEASSEFTTLAPRTQSDYRKHLTVIEAKFGTLPAKALGAKATRGEFKTWRDKLAEKSSRQADYAWTVLARVLSVAVDRGLISVNPCRSGGRLYSSDRADKIWSNDQIDTFLKSAPQHLHMPLMLALWTGQREGDVLRLEWTAYDGETIRVKTGKTGAYIAIHVGKPLLAMLDATKRTTKTICTTEDGKPWTPSKDGQFHGFASSWQKAMTKAKLDGEDLHFHDLRGTAITRLADAGCTVPEIRSLTGHSLATINRILEKYLARTSTQSKSALAKLEKHLERNH